MLLFLELKSCVFVDTNQTFKRPIHHNAVPSQNHVESTADGKVINKMHVIFYPADVFLLSQFLHLICKQLISKILMIKRILRFLRHSKNQVINPLISTHCLLECAFVDLCLLWFYLCCQVPVVNVEDQASKRYLMGKVVVSRHRPKTKVVCAK